MILRFGLASCWAFLSLLLSKNQTAPALHVDKWDPCMANVWCATNTFSDQQAANKIPSNSQQTNRHTCTKLKPFWNGPHYALKWLISSCTWRLFYIVLLWFSIFAFTTPPRCVNLVPRIATSSTGGCFLKSCCHTGSCKHSSTPYLSFSLSLSFSLHRCVLCVFKQFAFHTHIWMPPLQGHSSECIFEGSCGHVTRVGLPRVGSTRATLE